MNYCGILSIENMNYSLTLLVGLFLMITNVLKKNMTLELLSVA